MKDESESMEQVPEVILNDRAEITITIFAIHSPFLLPSFFRREEKREKEYPKSWSKLMTLCSIILND